MIRYAGMVSGALALTAVVTAQPAVASANHAQSYAELRQVMRRLTTQDGAVGAQAVVNGRRGRTAIAEGVGDLRTGAPMPRGGRFRIGSLTKTFVATVVLQLVGEGKVDLDAPVEDYLPGLVRGNDNDGREITVRNLLQHTSGLPDYLEIITPQKMIETRFEHREPRDLVRIAVGQSRLFKPGSRWRYSNTNYLLAGMLIKSVTGRRYGKQIQRRILWPLRLRDTDVPGDRTGIPGRHPRGYVKQGPHLLDITDLNPSMAAGSGDMISSANDLNRFLGALVGGRLLRSAQLREMMKPPRIDDPSGNPSGRHYGLGLEKFSLSGCRGEFWGHAGDMLGFTTRSGATLDGRQVTVMVNLKPGGTQAQKKDQDAAVSAAFCDQGRVRAQPLP